MLGSHPAPPSNQRARIGQPGAQEFWLVADKERSLNTVFLTPELEPARGVAEEHVPSPGRGLGLVIAVGTAVVWAAAGPAFHFNDTWQLTINIGTHHHHVFMFLIRMRRTADASAKQLEFNELVRAVDQAG
jgi:hypothetical protein